MDKDTLAPEPAGRREAGPQLDAAVAAALGWDEATIAALVPVIHFSTRIEDAWRVVERMAEDGWAMEINHEPYSPYEVLLFRKDRGSFCSGEADFPHAISLAALAALEGE